jgi:hypothetical protein
MRAINHALTGAIIGLTVSEPFVAVPAALLSHYVLDVIPHYGTGKDEKSTLKSNVFRNQLILDAAFCLILVLVLAISTPINWELATICAFLAAAPDFASMPRYLSIRSGKKHQRSRYEKFATKIQWFERPVGGFVEVTWFVAAIFILSKFVN